LISKYVGGGTGGGEARRTVGVLGGRKKRTRKARERKVRKRSEAEERSLLIFAPQ